MLLRVLFLCFAAGVLGETLLRAAASLATAAFHRQGILAAQSEFIDATQFAQGALADAIAGGGAPPSILPSPAPTCVVASTDGCALTATAALSLATPSPSPCPSTGCGVYLQGNDAVDEGRADLALSITVTNAVGQRVATRDGTVVFRTMRVAPYAVPAGMLDSTLAESAGTAGDLGGDVPSSATLGTLIDVVYQNAQSGATMPANVWSGLPASAPLGRAWSP